MRNKDLADLTKRFAKIPQEIKTKVRPSVDQGADEMIARMRYLAPSERGDLSESIKREPGPVDLSATITVHDEAALYQEYGTQNMPASPFFWISVRSLRDRVRRRIDRAISKAIKESWK